MGDDVSQPPTDQPWGGLPRATPWPGRDPNVVRQEMLAAAQGAPASPTDEELAQQAAEQDLSNARARSFDRMAGVDPSIVDDMDYQSVEPPVEMYGQMEENYQSHQEALAYDLMAGGDQTVVTDPNYQSVRPSDDMMVAMSENFQSHQAALDYDVMAGVDPNIVSDPDYQTVRPSDEMLQQAAEQYGVADE